MGAYIPSLSEQGWITDPYKILNNAVSYYLLTDVSQSLVFQNNLTSLSYTYYRFINDPDGMASQVTIDLERVLGRYFPQVEVTVDTKALTETRYGLLVYVSVLTNDNTKVNLSKVVDMSTSGLRRVLNVNNFGDGQQLLNDLI